MSGGRRYYNDETTKMRKGERTMMLQYSKGWMRDELMVVLTRQTCCPSGEERNGLLLSTEWDGGLMKISGCNTSNVTISSTIGTDDDIRGAA